MTGTRTPKGRDGVATRHSHTVRPGDGRGALHTCRVRTPPPPPPPPACQRAVPRHRRPLHCADRLCAFEMGLLSILKKVKEKEREMRFLMLYVPLCVRGGA